MSVVGYPPLCIVCLQPETQIAVVAGVRIRVCDEHAERFKPYLNAPERIAELEAEVARLKALLRIARKASAA